MKTEFECRFIDIDAAAVRAKLSEQGFAIVEPERLMRRKVFMLPDKDNVQRWLRLRDQGDKTTLTFKLKGDISQGAASMKEIECVVEDFGLMGELLAAADLKCAVYEENSREKWAKENVEVCLDTWPELDTFAEIEADSEAAVKKAASELGFDWNEAMFGNVMEVYKKKLGLDTAQMHERWAKKWADKLK
ncbi:MAG: CYTH domain-containing protein [Rickettsiales bacterium]|jgi:adenylate cyclase class 2|nr:CYTH domain-containing protein [Rickettsiales bacterium]